MLTTTQKPVSDLRARFENMLGASKSSAPPSAPQQRSATADRLAVSDDSRRLDGRISLDMPREYTNANRSTPSLANFNGAASVTPRANTVRTPWSNPKPRPISMMAFSPPPGPEATIPHQSKITAQSHRSLAWVTCEVP
jgi:hypothetical protein